MKLTLLCSTVDESESDIPYDVEIEFEATVDDGDYPEILMKIGEEIFTIDRDDLRYLRVFIDATISK